MNPQTRSEQKRAAILEAALSEFGAHGFDATSMDRIAATAGVSKRTVYNHFASKDALFEAIALDLVERVRRVTDHPYEPGVPLEAQLREIGLQLFDLLVSPCFVALAKVTLAETIRSPEQALKTYTLFRERQTGLARWLADASRDGRLEVEDPVWAADQFFGLIKSFAFWPQILGAQPVPDAAARLRIVGSSVAMLLGQYHRSP